MDLTPVKLVVTDMDGTLLNSSHQVSSRFFELFEALSKCGIQFAAASGRQYESIAVKLTPILDQLIVIAENGGLVRHQGRELLSTPLDPGLRDKVLERLENIPGTHVVLCGKDTAYLNPPTPEFERQLKEYYGSFEYLDRLQGFPGEIMKIAVYHFESSEQYIFPEVQGFEEAPKSEGFRCPLGGRLRPAGPQRTRPEACPEAIGDSPGGHHGIRGLQQRSGNAHPG